MLPGCNAGTLGFGGIGHNSQRVELAVERRAADLQPPGDLRHLPAIMRDREANHLGLDLLERRAPRPGASSSGERRRQARRRSAAAGCPAAAGSSMSGAIGAASASIARSGDAVSGTRGCDAEPTARPARRSAGIRRPRPRRPRPAPRRGTPRSRAGARCRASDSATSSASASPLIARMRLPSSAAKRARKCRASSGMSSGRSAQRRHRDRKDVQAVEQVFAEAAVPSRRRSGRGWWRRSAARRP